MMKFLRVLFIGAAFLAFTGCREKTPEDQAADAMKGSAKEMKEAAKELEQSADETLKDLTGE